MAIKNNTILPDITVEKFYEYSPKRGKKTNLLGFATVTVNNVTISGIKVMKSDSKDKNIWTSFPSQLVTKKDGTEEYSMICWLSFGSKEDNKLVYDAIEEAVEEYMNK